MSDFLQDDPDENGLVFKTADPLFASDPALRIVLWNKGAEALFGFTAREMIGTPCYELIGCRNSAGILACHGNCMQLLETLQHELVPTFDQAIRRKTGEQVWVNLTTILAPTKKGPSVLIHLFRDLTRQKELERLLHQLVSGAAKLDREPAMAHGTGGPATAAERPRPLVTEREREVLQLLAQGAATEAIAAKLFISKRTARNHIQNVISKLGVHSRLEAVASASAKGLL